MSKQTTVPLLVIESLKQIHSVFCGGEMFLFMTLEGMSVLTSWYVMEALMPEFKSLIASQSL